MRSIATDAGPGGGDTTLQFDGGADAEFNCGSQEFKIKPMSAPDVLIVLDRSGSMSNDANEMTLSGPKEPASKWMQVVTALKEGVLTVQLVNWGLMLFGGDNLEYCSYYSAPNVPVGPMNGMAIANFLDTITPAGATPTEVAIETATSYFQSLADNRAHYILLATDGQPNCNRNLNLGFDSPIPTEDAVTAAATAGIHTFVVGVGSITGADEVLTQLAMDGMEPNTTPGEKSYYTVATTSDLLALLDKIASQIVSCEYPLSTVPDRPDLVTVEGSLGALPRDTTHMDGWDFGPDNMSIVFYGATCRKLQYGQIPTVSAIYNCAPPM